jgi:putative hemolysin
MGGPCFAGGGDLEENMIAAELDAPLRLFIVGVDFDGTIVDHRYPDVGQPVPGATYWLRKFAAAGAKILLCTMRGQKTNDGDMLTPAVQYCQQQGIPLYGVNRSPNQGWTDSPKPYAHVYIDDSAACCPLKENPRMHGRPFVDWDIVGPAVLEKIEDSKPKKDGQKSAPGLW